MAGFISRGNWGARSPRSRSSNIASEAVTLHWGGPSPWRGRAMDHAHCAPLVRGWQNFHMDGQGWVDLAYNAVVCPHGYVFEGRWRGVRSAGNGTNAGNYRSYAVCYLAGEGDPLTDAAKLGFHEAARLLSNGIRWSHRDWKSTACPGTELDRWVKQGAPRPHPNPVTAAEFLRQMLLKIEFCSHGVFSIEGQSLRQDCVEVLQRVLNQKAGKSLTPDGYFGPATEQAVREVQAWTGLTVDGVAGPKTWDMLKR